MKEYEVASIAHKALPKSERGESPGITFPPRFLEFARSLSDEASLRACEFIVMKFYFAAERHDAMDLVVERRLDKPLIGQFLGNMVYHEDGDEAVDECLTKIAASAHENARIYATFEQAKLAMRRRKWLVDDPTRYDDVFDAARIASFQSEDARQRILAVLKGIVDANPQLPYFGKPLVEWAEQDLFELEHFEIGGLFPEISGQDSQGKHFQLSDYRGRVVVIAFWASWCGGCMKDLPHEIEFVESMKGRPLTWLGVNGDESVDRHRELEKERGINFRSWHDGDDGPIANQCAVRGWPAMFVVDANGVLRYKSQVSVDLDHATEAIEKLVSQQEAE